MASEAVYNFMKEQNRPYSINEILQNVGKELGKTAVQKAADKLVQKNHLFAKLYGKQKIYCVVQSDDIKPEEMEEELKSIDREIHTISLSLKSAEENLMSCSAQLKELNSKMSIEEAEAKRNILQNEIKEMQEKLDKFSKNVQVISEAEKNKICTEYDKQVKEYRKRKRICTDMINAILEGYPKTKKHLIEEIGIETDESVEFKLE